MKKLITIITLITCCSLTGCIHPYVPDVQQGNILKSTAVNQVQIGMSKQNVLALLETPVLVDVFNADIWTYVYTKQIRGGKIMKQDLVLYFKDNQLVKIKKDLTPTAIPKSQQK